MSIRYILYFFMMVLMFSVLFNSDLIIAAEFNHNFDISYIALEQSWNIYSSFYRDFNTGSLGLVVERINKTDHQFWVFNILTGLNYESVGEDSFNRLMIGWRYSEFDNGVTFNWFSRNKLVKAFYSSTFYSGIIWTDYFSYRFNASVEYYITSNIMFKWGLQMIDNNFGPAFGFNASW